MEHWRCLYCIAPLTDRHAAEMEKGSTTIDYDKATAANQQPERMRVEMLLVHISTLAEKFLRLANSRNQIFALSEGQRCIIMDGLRAWKA